MTMDKCQPCASHDTAVILKMVRLDAYLESRRAAILARKMGKHERVGHCAVELYGSRQRAGESPDALQQRGAQDSQDGRGHRGGPACQDPQRRTRTRRL